VNMFQFVLKLMGSGREFTLLSFGDRYYVEIGRYGCCFSPFGKSMGGWIHEPESDSEWNEWHKLLID
jgi:hypothetical protein